MLIATSPILMTGWGKENSISWAAASSFGPGYPIFWLALENAIGAQGVFLLGSLGVPDFPELGG